MGGLQCQAYLQLVFNLMYNSETCAAEAWVFFMGALTAYFPKSLVEPKIIAIFAPPMWYRIA